MRTDRYKELHIRWVNSSPANWQRRRLKSTLVSSKNGVWGDEPEEDGKGMLCIRVADFNRNSLRVDISNPTFRVISEGQLNGRLLKSGDLLLEKSGGGDNQPVGTVVIFDHNIPAVCSNFVAKIEVAPGHSPNFLKYLHAHLYNTRVTTRSIKQTTGIQNLDESSYFNEVVAIPPLEIQHTIAEFLDSKTVAIDALVETKQRMLELLAEQRDAMINQAVTKGLDPTVPMKDSGVPWIGDIPAHWEVRVIKNLGLLKGGAGFPHAEQGCSDYEIPFFKVKHLASAGEAEVLECSNDTVSVTTARRLGAYIFPSNTIVFAKVGEALLLKRFRALGVPSCIDNNMLGIVVDDERANYQFVLHSMKLLPFDMFVNPGAVPSLSANQVGSMPLAVPPVKEQSLVINMLARSLNSINNTEVAVQKQITLLHEYRQSLITAAVTGQLDISSYDEQSVENFEFPNAIQIAEMKNTEITEEAF